MKTLKKLAILLVFLSFSAICFAEETAARQKTAFKLANKYSDLLDLSEYLVSEKYDGVRAWWNGNQLTTRGGLLINAPNWFTADFGTQSLDGELWIDRGRFEDISSLIRRKSPEPELWRYVNYMVFDLPDAKGGFLERYQKLEAVVSDSGSPYLRLVQQRSVESRDVLMLQLDKIVGEGGEGLMLQRKAAPYQGKRSNDLVKLKPRDDAEATIVGYVPGKGKFQGMTGSLIVEIENGLRFRIGSGLSNSLRKNPPPVGSVITYKYSGKTHRGVPRFASFYRVRHLQ